MTQERVNSFVGDLVQMAQAFEELPRVKDELFHSRAELSGALNTVQSLELRIIDLKVELEDRASTIRALEVARDDAELRFLEADEKASKVLGMLDNIKDQALVATKTLEVPKPQPEPVAEVVQSMEEVQAQPVETHSSPWEGNGGGMSQPLTPDPVYPALPGQSEAGPTVQVRSNETGSAATSATVSQTENVFQQPMIESLQATAKAGLFAGLRYYDYPSYVRHDDWINNGGTEEDYNWRPGKEAAQ